MLIFVGSLRQASILLLIIGIEPSYFVIDDKKAYITQYNLWFYTGSAFAFILSTLMFTFVFKHKFSYTVLSIQML